MSSTAQKIDFKILEENAEFRADFLFFLRLVNTYIESVFWHVFEKTSSSGQRKKRKQLKDIVGSILDDGAFIEASLMDDIFLENNKRTLDVFSSDFKKILEKFPESLKQAFIDKMKIEHAIFISFPELLETLEQLRTRRNHLEHYPQNKRGDDEKISLALGRFLIPELLHVFSGRIAHYAKKEKDRSKREAIFKMKHELDSMFNEYNKFRRYETNKLFQFTRSKKDGNLHKSKRKSLVDPSLSWRIARLQTSGHESDYREHQFKLRYYFIGPRNLKTIQNMLADPDQQRLESKDRVIYRSDGKRLSFKRDIEPLYTLAMKIGLILHRNLMLCENYEENALNSSYSRNERQKTKKAEYKKKYDSALSDIKAVRDYIAHNNLFWDIYCPQLKRHLSPREVFQTVFDGLASRPFTNKLELLSNLHQQLEAEMKRENYAILEVEGDNTIHKIKKWTKEKRDECKNEKYVIDQRRGLKKLVAGWKGDADFAFDTARKNARSKVA